MSSKVSEDYSQYKSYSKVSKIALLVGVIGICLAGYGLVQGLMTDNSRPIYSWFIGFSVWLSVFVGLLFITMIWNVFDAGWAVILRRQVEHGLSILPWVFLFFIPLLLIAWFYRNPGILWDWMNPNLIAPGSTETIGHDPLYLKKEGFLNVPFFTMRVFLYFAIFFFFAYNLRKNSFSMDFDSDLKYARRKKIISSAGIPICALTTAFAGFDFYMSLSYEWFSTMFGVWFFATSMRAGLAVTVFILAFLARKGHLKGLLSSAQLYRLGCMFLAFTIFWAYITFCQYFLIYHGNIPEETFWFNMREVDPILGTKTSWWWISLYGLALGYFFIPFIYLLFYNVKKTINPMLFISGWIFIFFIIDLYFNILPAKEQATNLLGYVVQQFNVTIWDLASIIGLGGVCVWAFFRSIPKAEPIPIHDPRIEESLHAYE